MSKKMSRANILKRAENNFILDKEHEVYWNYFIKGLKRFYYKDTFISDTEHKYIISLRKSVIKSKKEMYKGYKDGLVGKFTNPGAPKRLEKTSPVTVRVYVSDIKQFPKGRKEKADFLREAIREAVQKKIKK
jgi:hypothetical protein